MRPSRFGKQMLLVKLRYFDTFAQVPGLEIWRVENRRDEKGQPVFGIKRVPKEMYRQFYRGDSYIVMHTYKENAQSALKWDIHFWIGSQSSQDEYGVAAYKAVELDDLLGGVRTIPDSPPQLHKRSPCYRPKHLNALFGRPRSSIASARAKNPRSSSPTSATTGCARAASDTSRAASRAASATSRPRSTARACCTCAGSRRPSRPPRCARPRRLGASLSGETQS